MGNRKTKLLDAGYLDWCLLMAETAARKRMHRFPEKGLRAGELPPDPRKAISLLLFGLDLPEILLDGSPASQNMCLDLARLVLTYPEYAAAAIYSVFVDTPDPGKPKGKSARVTEFLLTEQTVAVPGGKRVSQVAATDGEIALAVEKKYGLENVSVEIVASARKRLEQQVGVRVSSLVDAILKTTEGLDRLVAKGSRAKAREERRALALRAFYSRR